MLGLENMEEETKIMVALIAASSAIAGATISQFVSILRDWLNKRHQRKILLRKKYEELANLITQSQEWVTFQLGAQSMLELNSRPPQEARKAMVLSHIYFPLLQEACQNYVDASAAFQSMLADNHRFAPGRTAGAQAVRQNEEAFMQAINNLRQCRNELDKQIIRYAKQYTKA